MGRPQAGLGGARFAFAAALSALLLPFNASAAPPPGGPLDAGVFDTSTFPDVLVDVVPPSQFAAVTLTPDMVAIAGATVDSVTRVDPAAVVVSLVIDDSPALSPELVQAEQGASVELVREVGDGTEIALATPSGMQSALTPDREANIARISGITAGSPDVVPLPELVLRAATTLAESAETDRRLVIVQGTPIPAGKTLDQIAAVVDAAGITVDLVAAPDLETGPIASLALASGGLVPSAPTMVGEMDQIAASIVDRFRVAATVTEPGTAEVALTVDGQRFTAPVAFAAPPVPTTPATASTVPATTAVPASSVPSAAPPTPTTVADAAVPAPPVTTVLATSTTTDPGIGRGTRMMVAVIVAALVVVALVVLLLLRRRAARPGAPLAAPTLLEPPPVGPAPFADPVPGALLIPSEVLAPAALEPASTVEPEPEPEPWAVVDMSPPVEPEPEPERGAGAPRWSRNRSPRWSRNRSPRRSRNRSPTWSPSRSPNPSRPPRWSPSRTRWPRWSRRRSWRRRSPPRGPSQRGPGSSPAPPGPGRATADRRRAGTRRRDGTRAGAGAGAPAGPARAADDGQPGSAPQAGRGVDAADAARSSWCPGPAGDAAGGGRRAGRRARRARVARRRRPPHAHRHRRGLVRDPRGPPHGGRARRPRVADDQRRQGRHDGGDHRRRPAGRVLAGVERPGCDPDPAAPQDPRPRQRPVGPQGAGAPVLLR